MDVLKQSTNSFWNATVEKKFLQNGTSLVEAKSTLMVQLFLIIVTVATLTFAKVRNSKSYGKVGKNGSGNQIKPVQVNRIWPINIPIIQSLFNIYELKRDGTKWLDRNMKEYGHFYEMPFGLNSACFVSDPVIAQKILTSNDINHLNKPKEYREILLKGFLEDALFSANTDIFFPHKKVLNRGFTYKSLQSYLELMCRNSQRMTKELMEASANTGGILEGDKVVDLQFNTVKIIADIILGTEELTSEETWRFAKLYERGKNLFLERLYNPILFFKPIWWIHPKRREFERVINDGKQFIRMLTNRYREKRKREQEQGITWVEAPADDEAGLKPFRSILEEMIHGGLTDKEIEEEVLMLLITGHETTSIAINTLMFHLALNQEYQKQCIEEVDAILASKNVEDDYSCELNMDDLNNMKVMERCILENLRILPVVAIFIRRLDAPLKIDENLTLEGNGKNVFVMPWCMHRNPEYFPNPEKFDPDRFLPEKVKERQAKNFYAYIPFSSGQRNCLGWKMSMLETKMVMFWLLRNFEIYTKDKFEDIKFRLDITLHTDREINLTLKRRR